MLLSSPQGFKTVKYEEVHLWDYQTYEDVIKRIPYFLGACRE